MKSLRENELMAIHGHFIPYEEDGHDVVAYLLREFSAEELSYPKGEYKYEKEAALWAAKLIYNASQLMINRDGVIDTIKEHLNPYSGELSRDSILSADLMLRFLPDIVEKLIEIDLEDPLIELLESIGKRWHYSYMPIVRDTTDLDMTLLDSDPIMLQLYAEKAALINNQVILKHESVENYLKENLGIYKDQLI